MSFSHDLEFLRQHVSPIVLGREGNAQAILVPEYQGRTLTSTSGYQDRSYGWINYKLIESRQTQPKINLYGGEDRFWVSPEGGQFSIFFEPGAQINFENWRTPDSLDTVAFEVLEKDERSARFHHHTQFANQSGAHFQVGMDRRVQLLEDSEVAEHLAVDTEGIHVVAHESQNTLSNRGLEPWLEATGLLSIWILGMNRPSPRSTVIVPFKAGSEVDRGTIVNADYFGVLDATRLRVDPTHKLIYFLGDGNFRSKIGLTFERSCSWMASWDANLESLTLVQFTLPDVAPHGYSNNLWDIQEFPYKGDVINSYNDGPNETGDSLGGFYELESLSPALALRPGESYCHTHRTFHFDGPREALDRLSKTILGVNLNRIESQFPALN